MSIASKLIGTSPGMLDALVQLERLARQPTVPGRRVPSVLIQGETGTGKGLVAHLLHQEGPRRAGAFVDVNCAAIPETLLEAELFGFERGAFTDARQAKAGLLQVAHEGTIFLDEIGLMPDVLQAKLLKALEDRAVRRLGSTRAEPVDAWVIAATSENLAEAIRARRFREDLYHRLAVVTLRLPPLRERGEDVLVLAREFLSRACREYGVPAKRLQPSADRALRTYSWPGNVRELANIMERVALLTDATDVEAAALALPGDDRQTRGPAGNVDDQLAALEKDRLKEALEAESGNLSRAAARLGLARNTFRYRLERHGLSGPKGAALQPDGTARERGRASAAAPPRLLDSPTTVKWQNARVTLLRADVRDAGTAPTHERAALLDTLAVKVETFGGRLLDRDAAGVTGAFGLEVAEDAPRHAVHAALAMQLAIRAGSRVAEARPELRVAIHTADMRTARAGARVELDADARRIGDSELQRLLAASPPDRVAISAGARPFLERRFILEEGPSVPSGAAVHWYLGGVGGGAATPFVARTRELGLLQDLLAQAVQSRGQAALIVGDPGIGKSRLLHELRRTTGDRAEWREASALPYGNALPLHPFITILKDALGIETPATDEDVRRRINRSVGQLEGPVRGLTPFLHELLGSFPGNQLPVDPKLRRAGILDALRTFFLATAERRPLVLVLEDVHWMDPESLEFLGLMTDAVTSAAVLLCVTHRTGFALPFGDVRFGTRITMERMSPEHVFAIAGGVLGAPAVAPELQRLLEERTDGNPFFVEEVTRSLQERKLIDVRGGEARLTGPSAGDVPQTVEDVIHGRLQRLDAPSRQLLQVAAAIGREFARAVLEQTVGEPPEAIDAALQSLHAAGLVQRGRLWPEPVYQFRHALTQEVAYLTQSDGERQLWHGRIAAAIERRYQDRVHEHAGVLAHHFGAAGEWQKALEYLLAAALQAEQSSATREALALYERAERAAGSAPAGADPATLIRIYEARARLHFATSNFERSAAEGERILPIARLAGDRAKEAEALATIAWADTWSRRLDDALRHAQEAIAVAEPIGADAVQGRAHFTIGWVRAVTGGVEESRQALDRSIRLSRAAGDVMYQSLGLSTAGLLLNWEGRFGDAIVVQNMGRELAGQSNRLLPRLFNCFLTGLSHTGRGNYQDALARYAEGLALAEQVGDEAIHHRLLNCLGWVYAELGDLDRAEALNTASAQIGRRRRDPGTQPNAELNLGDILKARGELAAAHETYQGVYRYFRNPSTSEWMRFRYSMRMFASMGELALAQGELGAARTFAAECLELATRTNARKNLAKGWRLLGEIARAQRDSDRAEGHLRQALGMAINLPSPAQVWRTAVALGHLLRDAGREDDARESWRLAARTMRDVRATLHEPGLSAAFEKSKERQMVETLAGDAVGL